MSGTRKSTFTNIRTKKNGNTGGERTGKNTDEQTHTSQKINDSSNSFSHPNSTPEPELNDEQTETPQEKLTNRLSKYNELLPTGTNTKTDQELTGLMLQIIEERNILLELYCIVEFFDGLFLNNKKQDLSAIDLAEKSVQSMTNLIKNNPDIFNKTSLSEDQLKIANIIVSGKDFLQIIRDLLKLYPNLKNINISDIIRILTDGFNLHPKLIDKFNNNDNIQNYLLSLARLKILDQQSSNQDRTEEEQKALDDYNNFVAKIKTITEIKEIWDNHQ